ncbi:MAG: GNAT family N-acetyltransferase [Cyclobacteriaceae bacterium]|nr:GNAT family N-acetyltransferase [Cyclobacteriaceae bacterium]
MDLIETNVNNMTALWKTAGQLAGKYIEERGYRMSIAGSGAWPDKLWFTKPLSLQMLPDILLKWNHKEVSVPIWGESIDGQAHILKANGYEEKMTQVAMSIALEKSFDHANRLTIEKVFNGRTAHLWSRLFHKAFGYEISAETVMKTMANVDYFLGKHNGAPIGTAVLFIDESGTAGIHSMGIIPTQRRNGYAEELLIHMLNKARLKGSTLVTLQASDMGKGLYLKKGMQEDFIIKTFIKHKR